MPSSGQDIFCKLHPETDSAGEGGDAGDGPPQDEGVDVVGALVRVDSLQVHHVPAE